MIGPESSLSWHPLLAIPTLIYRPTVQIWTTTNSIVNSALGNEVNSYLKNTSGTNLNCK